MPLVPVVGSPNTYCQASDLANVGALPGWFQSLTSAQINEAIQTASALMDGYFVARFQLPLVQVSYDVVLCCASLSVYILVAPRGYNPNNPAELVYETRYKQQISWLKDVANGQATPGVTDSSSTAAPGLPNPSTGPVAVSPTSTIAPGGISWNTWARR